MLFYVYDTLLEAEEAISNINSKLFLSKPGKNAATGKVNKESQWTVTWDTPRLMTNGKYAIIEPREEYGKLNHATTELTIVDFVLNE